MTLRWSALVLLTAGGWGCTSSNNPDVATVCPGAPVEEGQSCAGYQAGLRCPSVFGPVCTATAERIYCLCANGVWSKDTSQCDASTD